MVMDQSGRTDDGHTPESRLARQYIERDRIDGRWRTSVSAWVAERYSNCQRGSFGVLGLSTWGIPTADAVANSCSEKHPVYGSVFE